VIELNVKKNTLIALLLTCLVAGSMLSVYADEYRPHLQVLVDDNTFQAGCLGELEITLYNGGDYDVIEVDAILTSAVSGITPVNGSQVVYANIEESETFTVDLLIDEDVPVGGYILTLQLSYLINGYEAVAASVPIGVVIDQPSLPMVKITSSTSKIMPGEVNKLAFTIQNIAATEITGVDISLASSNFLISLQDEINFNVPTLEAGESQTFDVFLNVLENTPIGAYSLTANVWYTGDTGITMSQVISVPLEVTDVAVTRRPVVTIRNVSPETVLPGEAFTLNLEVSCTGAPMYNAKAVISMDAGGLISPTTPTTVSLGDLSADGKASFSYGLLLSGSASASDLLMTVSVVYLDTKGVQGAATETLTIPVEDIIEFSLLEDTVIVAEVGAETEFEADVLLIGTGSVDFASISVVSDESVESVTGSTEYIGTIDPDSPAPFTLRFKTTNGTVPGDYELTLKITYLNNRNVEATKTIAVPLQVVNPMPINNTSNDEGIWGWIKRLFGMQ